MTIEIGHFLGDISNSTYSSSGLNSIFGSVLYTSILLSIILLLIICFIYPCKKNTPLWVTFKLMFYVFIGVLSVLYLHHGALYHKYEKKIEDRSVSNLINGINNPSPAYEGDRIQVNPILVTGGNETNNASDIKLYSNKYSPKPFMFPQQSLNRKEPENEITIKSDQFGSLKNQNGEDDIITNDMSTDDMLKAMGV